MSTSIQFEPTIAETCNQDRKQDCRDVSSSHHSKGKTLKESYNLSLGLYISRWTGMEEVSIVVAWWFVANDGRDHQEYHLMQSRNKSLITTWSQAHNYELNWSPVSCKSSLRWITGERSPETRAGKPTYAPSTWPNVWYHPAHAHPLHFNSVLDPSVSMIISAWSVDILKIICIECDMWHVTLDLSVRRSRQPCNRTKREHVARL